MARTHFEGTVMDGPVLLCDYFVFGDGRLYCIAQGGHFEMIDLCEGFGGYGEHEACVGLVVVVFQGDG